VDGRDITEPGGSNDDNIYFLSSIPLISSILVQNVSTITQSNVDLTNETNVDQVFSRVGQLSEVNLDADSITESQGHMSSFFFGID
jgi:hypothetical protein